MRAKSTTASTAAPALRGHVSGGGAQRVPFMLGTRIAMHDLLSRQNFVPMGNGSGRLQPRRPVSTNADQC